MNRAPRIIVALDFSHTDAALGLVNRLDPARCRLKIGHELFAAGGPELVHQLVQRGFAVFLDLNFHDIPNTVAGACRVAATLGVWMVNLHVLGGRRMMAQAREALEAFQPRPLLVGVTVLTSHGAEDLAPLGLKIPIEELVLNYAALAHECGLDGVVCSADELPRLRKSRGEDFVLVTPGIRPEGAEAADQRRVATPRRAIEQGADYLVIGRPVTRASDPPVALAAIEDEIE